MVDCYRFICQGLGDKDLDSFHALLVNVSQLELLLHLLLVVPPDYIGVSRSEAEIVQLALSRFIMQEVDCLTPTQISVELVCEIYRYLSRMFLLWCFLFESGVKRISFSLEEPSQISLAISVRFKLRILLICTTCSILLYLLGIIGI